MAISLDTVYGRHMPIGYEGQCAFVMEPEDADSLTNESSTAIEFGRAVVAGTSDVKCKPLTSTSEKVIGVSLRHAVMEADANGEVSYKQWKTLPVLKEGYVYVKASGTVSKGDLASVVVSTNLFASTNTDASSSAAKSGGNTGNGTLTLDVTTPILADHKAGVYTVRCTAAATNSGTFEVRDPKGYSIGTVAVGATFSNQIKFVIADGSTDFVVGDGFDITVAAGRILLDGTSSPLVARFDSSGVDGDIVVLAVESV